jgi:RNA polymerase sigma-70 factor (ECF subfamily)
MERQSADGVVRDLYARHGGAVLAYLRRLGAAHHDAEDVVQETMVRAWRHAATLDTASDAVRGWLFTVARHVLIDRLRVRSAAPAGMEPPGAETAQSDHQSLIVERVVMLDALARLSPEHRTAVVEVYYRGRTVDSVAAALGVPAGTVKSRLHYGLRKLREMLETELRDDHG